jgi:hypothetical protein
MKPFLRSLVCILLISHVSIISCKEETPAPPKNQPPIARAGADQNIPLSSCSSAGSAELDGTASTDPENKIVRYIWEQLTGPTSVTLTNTSSAKTSVQNILVGTYTFQLSVVDAGGFISRDEVVINAIGIPDEYDLDISYSGPYNFTDNIEDCYYGPPCYYYDLTTINGITNLPSMGNFNLSIYEPTDSAATSFSPNASFSLYGGNVNGNSITGSLNVNFKRLIQQGGGPFNSTLSIEYGSAQTCKSDVFTNLSPLSVVGALDTLAKSVTLRITGKVYF